MDKLDDLEVAADQHAGPSRGADGEVAEQVLTALEESMIVVAWEKR